MAREEELYKPESPVSLACKAKLPALPNLNTLQLLLFVESA